VSTADVRLDEERVFTSTRVPVSRYVAPEFAALEVERLWPRVWQIACTVDHVRREGDYFEYVVGPYSVIVVRGDDGELRGFQNVCRHRGNTLCQGAGEGLMELRCPWHGWTWGLDGRLREVPSRRWFGALRNDDFPLFPVQVGTWGPLVFVNLDLDAPPLDDYLEGVPGDSAWADLHEFHCMATTTSEVPCNWKVIADGFGETYHVQGLHREMLGSIDDLDTPQVLWGHHGVSYQRYGIGSPRLGELSDQEVWDSFVETQGGRMGSAYAQACPAPPVPDGATMRDVIAELIRTDQAAKGADLARFTTDQVLRLSQYNLFPNATVLVWADMVNVLIGRPGLDPDHARLVTFTMYRGGDGARPIDVTLPEGASMGLVLDQDLSVMRTAQRGLHQPGLTHLTVSSEECRVLNLQHNLERYLGIEPSELVTT
jgi:choline monooxygenase